MAVKRFAITVTGRVQGVGFRYFAKDAADSLGLLGWVRNSFDRSVECEVQGEEADVEQFCSRLREGPPLSRISDFFIHEMPTESGAGPEFEISF
jgi:acylphosphatase